MTDILLLRFDVESGDGPGDATLVEQVDSGDIGGWVLLFHDKLKVCNVGVARTSRLGSFAIDSRRFLCARIFWSRNERSARKKEK
jgi:hypothetical protein